MDTTKETVNIYYKNSTLDYALNVHEDESVYYALASVNGHPMQGTKAKTLEFLFQEIFLDKDYEFDCDVDDPVIVDCGANIGFATLFFKQKWPKSSVHAFEANENAFELLVKNVGSAPTGFQGDWNVSATLGALAKEKGVMKFYVKEGSPTTLKGSTRQDRGGDKESIVPAIRLSDAISSLPRIDAIKMDIEGAEWDVVADMLEAGMLSKPKQWMIEYHHQIGSDPAKLSEFLRVFEEAGYRYTIGAKRNGDPKDFQDMMIHFVR